MNVLLTETEVRIFDLFIATLKHGLHSLGSMCTKETGQSMARVDSPVPLMHMIQADPDPDHPKETDP